MDAACLLLMFFAIQGRSCNGEDNRYCTEQRGSTIVEQKGSLTISCNFTYPKQKHKPEDVRVSWKRGTGRCANTVVVYNHTGGWTHNDYKGRISPVGNPNNDGVATIIINNLRRETDSPMFCCRVEIYEGSKYKEGWHNRHGTSLQYRDEPSVEQTDVVPAIIGEDIIIPCVVRYRDPALTAEVTWTMGRNDVCSDNNNRTEIWKENNKSRIRGRWSLVNFPFDLSLRIRDVTAEDNQYYCCSVKGTLRNNDPLSTIQGTEVVVVDASKNPRIEVVQPASTSPDNSSSATLTCSYTHRSDIDPLWTVVFWRVGSPTGSYAYHPFTDMVDPGYRGRTELRGPTDLHIKGVKVTDNTTYYCFVMLKFCAGRAETISNIQYGSGTRLQVTGLLEKPYTTWIYILAAALLALIILCAVIIILLKKRGVICRERDGLDMALKEQSPPASAQMTSATASAPPTAQEDSGGILYAHLNVSSLQQKTNNRSKGNAPDDSQVLYAAVKSPAAPQDIYSTVDMIKYQR